MLGDNIRKYRKLNNMSQDELAEKLNVTRQSISLWENGQTQPSLENIVALSKLFKVSTDELLESDKTDIPATNTATPQKPEDPKKKPNNLFLLVGIAAAVVVLLVVVIILLGGCNSKNNGGTNEPQTTEAITENNIQTSEEIDEEDIEETEEVTENNVQAAATTVSTTEVAAVEDEKDIYGYLKSFVIENGTINGDYCYYSKTADNYGGYASEDFSLYYWGDTDTIEFCLHSVLDETFSINFYLYVPKNHTGKYEYVSSYYYRDTGDPLYEAKGTIDAAEFTDNYPLNCTKYTGSTEYQNNFMEMSREGVCDLLGCLEKFIEVENIKYSFKDDFGFLKFKLNRS